MEHRTQNQEPRARSLEPGVSNLELEPGAQGLEPEPQLDIQRLTLDPADWNSDPKAQNTKLGPRNSEFAAESSTPEAELEWTLECGAKLQARHTEPRT